MSIRNHIVSLFEKGIPKRAIARQLGVNESTVRRHLKKREIHASSYGNGITEESKADFRATRLKTLLREMVVNTNWPVINSENICVDSRIKPYLNHETGETSYRASAPRTYINDCLKVAKIEDYKGRVFIFSRAQNDTPVHDNLYRNMLAYAKARKADIVIGPDTYETSWFHESNEYSRNYDKRIEKFLCFGRMEIGPEMFFAGEMNILTTAVTPISDLISYSCGKWCVVPHSKQQLESIPRTDPRAYSPQILTTGSITIPKVIPRKAGIKSIFHHILGFVVAEFDEEGDVFLRHVNAGDDGSFYDLDYFVENEKVSKIQSERHYPDYLMPGDVHRGKLDLANQKDVMGTFGFNHNFSEFDNKNILTVLKPKRIILQDLHDGDVDSHYNFGDMGHKVETAGFGQNVLETEVYGDGYFLRYLELTHPELEEIIVDESNHDLRILRYISEGRHREDPNNVLFGLKLEQAYLEYRKKVGLYRNTYRADKIEKFSLHEYAIRELFPDMKNVKWIYDGDSLFINGVECGHHGFRGTNGSKATLSGYVRIGCKISYGDKHAPAIRDGAYQAGVVTLNQRYNKGPSSWAVSHILQYANGSRAIITMRNGKYRFQGNGRNINEIA